MVLVVLVLVQLALRELGVVVPSNSSGIKGIHTKKMGGNLTKGVDKLSLEVLAARGFLYKR